MTPLISYSQEKQVPHIFKHAHFTNGFFCTLLDLFFLEDPDHGFRLASPVSLLGYFRQSSLALAQSDWLYEKGKQGEGRVHLPAWAGVSQCLRVRALTSVQAFVRNCVGIGGRWCQCVVSKMFHCGCMTLALWVYVPGCQCLDSKCAKC